MACKEVMAEIKKRSTEIFPNENENRYELKKDW